MHNNDDNEAFSSRCRSHVLNNKNLDLGHARVLDSEQEMNIRRVIVIPDSKHPRQRNWCRVYFRSEVVSALKWYSHDIHHKTLLSFPKGFMNEHYLLVMLMRSGKVSSPSSLSKLSKDTKRQTLERLSLQKQHLNCTIPSHDTKMINLIPARWIKVCARYRPWIAGRVCLSSGIFCHQKER